jgi:hypothetical protein
VPIVFDFLLQLEHSSEWDTACDDDDDDYQLHQQGAEAVDRLAVSLGGNCFLGVATPLIQQFMQSSDWTRRVGSATAHVTFISILCALLTQISRSICNFTHTQTHTHKHTHTHAHIHFSTLP